MISPEPAKRTTEVPPVASKVMPVATEEEKSQERREEIRLMQGEGEVDKVIGPEPTNRHTEVVPVASEVMPVAMEEEKSEKRREEKRRTG